MKPSAYNLDDPIAAIATALAPAALGIVRASGRDCVNLITPFFSRPEALRAAAGNSAVHGWMVDPADGQSRRVDEVVAVVYRAPRSFTGEESVEILCHGGPSTVLAIYRLLLRGGLRAAERGEFTFRSFIHGKTDLARSEAVREIIEARTDTARAHAADRLSGSLSAAIKEVSALAIHALAAIGAEIEYPEDEDTTKGAFDRAMIEEAANRLSVLESAWSAERLYREGSRIVLAGRTNAGKSSLFNTLLKEERSIVSDIHGTTRDWLESWLDFNGIPVRLYDTAGIRLTSDSIEAEGVERSLALAGSADLVLYLVDAVSGLNAEDEAFCRNSATPLILVWNKADRPDALQLPSREIKPDLFSNPVIRALCPVSAKQATGIAELVETIVTTLKEDTAAGSGQDCGIGPGTERQKRAIEGARLSLQHALQAEAAGFPLDAITQDLEDAIATLGEITGEVTTDDILDVVFSGFCVGK